MRASIFLAFIIACFTNPTAEAAGFRFIDIPADANGPALTGAVWSPCAEPPEGLEVRFVRIIATRNCPVAGERLPLIVISHGSGGWFGAHHDTAVMLADAGFVVAAVNHPGDSATDSSRSDSLSILIDRPADIRRVTDFMLDAWPEASKLDGNRIGLFGFSRGAYTGLIIAGGQFDIAGIAPLCPKDDINGMCEQIRKGEIPAQHPADDSRFKAAILADPEFGRAFTPERLKNVKIPIQLWSSSRGGDGVLPVDGATVDSSLPARPDYRVVPNSAHFAFMAPCSVVATAARPDICADADAFDRTAFHKEFNAAMLAFLRQHLVGRGR